MRALVAAVLTGCVLALPAFGADNAPPKKVAANRMDPATGAFHRVHARKLKLACETCHDGKTAESPQMGKSRGTQVAANRDACLSCHQSPAKPAWYPPAS
jgi:nitrate/TMAO reductase-like tetraheme cytochrome c subunit